MVHMILTFFKFIFQKCEFHMIQSFLKQKILLNANHKIKLHQQVADWTEALWRNTLFIGMITSEWMFKEKGFFYVMKQPWATVFSSLIFHWRVELEAQCWVLKLSCLIVDLNLKMSMSLSFCLVFEKIWSSDLLWWLNK